VGEGLRHFGQNPYRVRYRELACSSKSLPQGLALHIGHDVVQEFLRLAGIQERQDMWVLELRCYFYFMKEALRAKACTQFRPEHLNSNHATMLKIAGKVDSGHAPVPELSLEYVSVC
jgi:hypothetical protein